jgi:hypothetical protein
MKNAPRRGLKKSKLHLIDALERLCLDHLFEQDICAALAQMETADVSDYDLGTLALWFFLLRKHRYMGLDAKFHPQILLCKKRIPITSKYRHVHGVLNVDEI